MSHNIFQVFFLESQSEYKYFEKLFSFFFKKDRTRLLKKNSQDTKEMFRIIKSFAFFSYEKQNISLFSS
jgi:hypothetical protein